MLTIGLSIIISATTESDISSQIFSKEIGLIIIGSIFILFLLIMSIHWLNYHYHVYDDLKRIHNQAIIISHAYYAQFRGLTTVDIFENKVKQRLNHPFILYNQQVWTYQQINHAVNRLSQELLLLKLPQKSVICLIMENRAEYIIAWLAILKIGCIGALVNTQLSNTQMKHCIDTVRPSVILCDHEHIQQIQQIYDEYDMSIPPTYLSQHQQSQSPQQQPHESKQSCSTSSSLSSQSSVTTTTTTATTTTTINVPDDSTANSSTTQYRSISIPCYVITDAYALLITEQDMHHVLMEMITTMNKYIEKNHVYNTIITTQSSINRNPNHHQQQPQQQRQHDKHQHKATTTQQNQGDRVNLTNNNTNNGDYHDHHSNHNNVKSNNTTLHTILHDINNIHDNFSWSIPTLPTSPPSSPTASSTASPHGKTTSTITTNAPHVNMELLQDLFQTFINSIHYSPTDKLNRYQYIYYIIIQVVAKLYLSSQSSSSLSPLTLSSPTTTTTTTTTTLSLLASLLLSLDNINGRSSHHQHHHHNNNNTSMDNFQQDLDSSMNNSFAAIEGIENGGNDGDNSLIDTDKSTLSSSSSSTSLTQLNNQTLQATPQHTHHTKQTKQVHLEIRHLSSHLEERLFIIITNILQRFQVDLSLLLFPFLQFTAVASSFSSLLLSPPSSPSPSSTKLPTTTHVKPTEGMHIKKDMKLSSSSSSSSSWLSPPPPPPPSATTTTTPATTTINTNTLNHMNPVKLIGDLYEQFTTHHLSHENTPYQYRSQSNYGTTALLIYTSGTTGLSKATVLRHNRIIGAGQLFALNFQLQSTDRIYTVLPLFHSSAGMACISAAIYTGCTVIIRQKLSTRQFWKDCCMYNATVIQYIGELCRYLINTSYSPYEQQHRIRLAFGNGMRSDIWYDFQERFNIDRIGEFYGSTEGNVALFLLYTRPPMIKTTTSSSSSPSETAAVVASSSSTSPLTNRAHNTDKRKDKHNNGNNTHNNTHHHHHHHQTHQRPKGKGYGAIGHLGPITTLLSGFILVKYDIDHDTILRDPSTGLCIPCKSNEIGELLAPLVCYDPLRRYSGYFRYNDQLTGSNGDNRSGSSGGNRNGSDRSSSSSSSSSCSSASGGDNGKDKGDGQDTQQQQEEEETGKQDGIGIAKTSERLKYDDKIIYHVKKHNDMYFRTGDLLRRNRDGYWYFIDRIGDTFRFKGENVSTTEVSNILTRYQQPVDTAPTTTRSLQISQESVPPSSPLSSSLTPSSPSPPLLPVFGDVICYGVEIPGKDGRACMIAVQLLPPFTINEYKQPSSATSSTSTATTSSSSPGQQPEHQQCLEQQQYQPDRKQDDILFNFALFYNYCQHHLAQYARPVFIRFLQDNPYSSDINSQNGHNSNNNNNNNNNQATNDADTHKNNVDNTNNKVNTDADDNLVNSNDSTPDSQTNAQLSNPPSLMLTTTTDTDANRAGTSTTPPPPPPPASTETATTTPPAATTTGNMNTTSTFKHIKGLYRRQGARIFHHPQHHHHHGDFSHHHPSPISHGDQSNNNTPHNNTNNTNNNTTSINELAHNDVIYIVCHDTKTYVPHTQHTWDKICSADSKL